MSLKSLSPERVWHYFEEITKIPRPSKKEEKIIEYLLSFARKHNLEAEKDSVGNVLIRKPATNNSDRIVILQSHSDMVCEKNADVEHDFDTDPIDAYIEDGKVTARGTTLGADDGIGIASTLAVLESDSISHPNIEALFTSDEESGMTGANGLNKDFLKGKTLINLDSEDEGELFIGCAGGIDTTAFFHYQKESAPKNHIAFRLKITGLKGGHSGDEIHKGLGNANKIAVRLIQAAEKTADLRIADFTGGNLRNAIAREAFVHITLDKAKSKEAEKIIKKLSEDIKHELVLADAGLKVKLEKAPMPEFVIDKNTQYNLLRALRAAWHGVFAMSASIPGLVESSSNLAAVKFTDDEKIKVTTSQRSSSESAKTDIAETVSAVFELAGAEVIRGDGYPGWQPNPESEISKLSAKAYFDLFGVKPKVKAVHAGLECGLFLQKYPDMDMISFGPDVRGAHSPDEYIDIKSVGKFQDLLLEVLKRL